MRSSPGFPTVGRASDVVCCLSEGSQFVVKNMQCGAEKKTFSALFSFDLQRFPSPQSRKVILLKGIPRGMMMKE